MKTLKQFNIYDDTLLQIKLETVRFIKQILQRHPNIHIEDIMPVGLIETGEFQYKVSRELKDRQVITLLAYLMYYHDIKIEEITNEIN